MTKPSSEASMPESIDSATVEEWTHQAKSAKEEHPYLLARRLRANAYYRQAWHLWLAVLGNLGLLAVVVLLVVAYIHLSQKSQIRPYVVEVDRHGHAVAFEPAAEMAEPDDRMRIHTVALWLRSVRTVTADRELQRDLIWRAYAYTSGRAVTRLNEWWRREPPFTRAETHTITVEILSILRAAGEDNYKIQWEETFHTPGGPEERRERWEAFLTLHLDPPTVVEEVLTNPLGITVHDFDWSRLPEEGSPYSTNLTNSINTANPRRKP